MFLVLWDKQIEVLKTKLMKSTNDNLSATINHLKELKTLENHFLFLHPVVLALNHMNQCVIRDLLA